MTDRRSCWASETGPFFFFFPYPGVVFYLPVVWIIISIQDIISFLFRLEWVFFTILHDFLSLCLTLFSVFIGLPTTYLDSFWSGFCLLIG